jgi:hypothetical protein
MIAAPSPPPSPRVSTCRQRQLRRRAQHCSLKEAVRLAVDVCFRFSGRATQVKALWSDTERVWLGSKTYVDWSLSIENIDIPWAVATAQGAPEDAGELRDAVLIELNDYWADCLDLLPPKEHPRWLPLP